MLSRSKNLNESVLNRLDSTWGVSILLHLFFVLAAVAVYFQRAPTKSFQTIEMTVVEPRPVEVKSIDIRQAEKKPEVKPVEVAQKRVFGMNQKTLVNDSAANEEGLTVKAGNTLTKAPDNEIADPNLQDLPVPTDEFLIDTMPRVLTEIKVAYTEEARKRNVEGAIIFDLLIDKDGSVRQADMISGLGYGLDEAARTAMMQFRFAPALVKSQPVAVKIRYSYRIKLEK